MKTAPALRLITLHVSPFSERARWGLDHHGLAYEVVHHVPFLGERRLRKVVGARAGRATVPVLLADGDVVADSFEIARWADRRGAASPLVPVEHEALVRRWLAMIDATSDAGRTIITAGMLASGAALDETMPAGVPGAVRFLLRPVSAYGTRWFGRKYDVDTAGVAASTAQVRDLLLAIRAGLAGQRADAAYLVGTFTWADIAAATALQSIVPVEDRYIRLGPATRRVWTNGPLAAEFADLVAWRDALYERHRAQRVRPSRAAAA